MTDFTPMAVWIVNLLEEDPGQVIHALAVMMRHTPVDERLDLMDEIEAETIRRMPLVADILKDVRPHDQQK